MKKINEKRKEDGESHVLSKPVPCKRKSNILVNLRHWQAGRGKVLSNILVLCEVEVTGQGVSCRHRLRDSGARRHPDFYFK